MTHLAAEIVFIDNSVILNPMGSKDGLPQAPPPEALDLYL